MTPIPFMFPGAEVNPPALHRKYETLELVFGKDGLEAVERATQRLIRLKGTLRVVSHHDPLRSLSRAVAHRIQFARHQRGWTQEELADASGIKRPNISRMEAGRHDLRISTVEKVAAALGLDVGWLMKPWVPTAEDLAELRELTEFGMQDLGDSLDRLEQEE